ncbi:MAG: TolC family protein [Erythrobacter sp.]|uniref:TolC family protein n=1 Tax=Erythrobacter sp. TaxID=1042 RepID=UPI0026037FA1|nr:TolC family protein [Erythrobacter sp.]MDJ0979111.1 TolC family protein [Erythrobacter sp.]
MNASHTVSGSRARTRVLNAARVGVVVLCAAAMMANASSAVAQTYGPAIDPEVDTDSPSALNYTPDAVPAPLVTAVETSLAQNPQVLAGLAELAALDSDLKAANWQRYPALTAEVLATTGGSNAADADGLAVNLALEQPIWAGGGINSAIDAARISRDVGKTALREIRYDIMLAITVSYFDALLAFQRARVLDEGLAEMRGLVSSIERRVAQQVSPLADLTLARSRLTQLEVDLTTAQEQGAAAMLRLREFVGAPVPRPVLPASDLAAQVPVETLALEDTLGCSPSLDRLRAEVDLADANVRVTRSDLFPRLLLQLSQNELTGARAALVLRWQSGNGLSQFAATNSAEARVGQAIALLGQADRETRTRLNTEYVNLRASQRREAAGRIALEASSALVESYERQFVAGRRSWLDVLNAAREKVVAAVSQSDASVGVAGSAARILALSCRWRPEGV